MTRVVVDVEVVAAEGVGEEDPLRKTRWTAAKQGERTKTTKTSTTTIETGRAEEEEGGVEEEPMEDEESRGEVETTATR